MYYDPIKNIFAAIIKKFPALRIFFYKLLDLFFLRSWYVRRELRKIRNKLGDKLISVYDAGTGYGQYTYYISKKLRPATIFSVDVKEDWIADCKNFFKYDSVSFAVEDLTEISHTTRFDLIVCVDVMEHIEDDVKVFRNFYRALKPGGFLLINTPSVYGGSDVHGNEQESFISEHARDGYSKEDLIQKLSPEGFSQFESKYSYGFWGDKAWRLIIKTPMKILNFSKLFLILLPFYFIIALPAALAMMYIDYTKNNNVGSGITFIARKL